MRYRCRPVEVEVEPYAPGAEDGFALCRKRDWNEGCPVAAADGDGTPYDTLNQSPALLSQVASWSPDLVTVPWLADGVNILMRTPPDHFIVSWPDGRRDWLTEEQLRHLFEPVTPRGGDR